MVLAGIPSGYCVIDLHHLLLHLAVAPNAGAQQASHQMRGRFDLVAFGALTYVHLSPASVRALSP